MEGKIFIGITMAFLLIGFASFGSPAKNQEKKGKATPVISRSFAAQSLRLGDTWKIYLKASDQDGDMKYIMCTMDQPGMATYPAALTRIKRENQKEFSGYIYLNTVGVGSLNLSSLALTVQIQDRAGNFSDPVFFHLRFQTGISQEAPPEGTFQEIDLGPIMISLQPTSSGGG